MQLLNWLVGSSYLDQSHQGLNMVYLLFTTNEGWVAKTIRFMTRSEYSHVDFLFEKDCGVGYYALGSTVKKGVEVVSILDRIKGSSKYCVMEALGCEDVVRDSLISQIGKPYDWTAVFGYILRRNWNDDQAWFCSELISWGLKVTGLRISNKVPWRVTPQDLLESPNFSINRSLSFE